MAAGAPVGGRGLTGGHADDSGLDRVLPRKARRLLAAGPSNLSLGGTWRLDRHGGITGDCVDRIRHGGHAAATALPLAIHWFWLAAIWLALGPQMIVGFQLALTLATWFAVGIWLERQAWFNAAPYRWLDPWALQAEGTRRSR